MGTYNDMFGAGAPLGIEQDPHRLQHLAAQNQAIQNQARLSNMAGGGAIGGIASGTMQGQYTNQWGSMLTPPQIRDKTRNHIANEVEKMAEEIGAPTLLHAVVLAIRTMEIPE